MLDDKSDSNAASRGGTGFSRRNFLRGSSVAAAATALANSPSGLLAQEKSAVVPAEAVPVTLMVNGKSHELKLEPRVTLLSALRDDLNLTGAKEVCSTTNCGACTVIIDGKPVLSCARTAIECQGKKIETVESIAKDNPVVQAFIKHDATQCGYCTPGFVVAVKAFVDQNPGADLDKVLKGLGGNLCRCGTYDGVAKAAVECCKGGK